MMNYQRLLTNTGLVFGILAGLGIAPPLQAQIEEPPVIDDTPAVLEDDEPNRGTPSRENLPTDDDDGLPEGAESPPEAGLPDAGQVLNGGNAALDQVILLNINGEPRYYVPVNLDANQASQLEGRNIPTYNLSDDGATSESSGINNPVEEGEGFVTEPFTGSLEDLEPEDIIE